MALLLLLNGAISGELSKTRPGVWRSGGPWRAGPGAADRALAEGLVCGTCSLGGRQGIDGQE